MPAATTIPDRGRRRAATEVLMLLLGLAVVAAPRIAMLRSSYFEEIQYERAPMGLQALAVLRGEAPIMNWSEPYHGSVFSWLLAPFYALHGDPVSTYTWVSIAFNELGVIAAYFFARRLWGRVGGFATLAAITFSSAYYSFYAVNSYAVFQTLGGIALLAAIEHLSRRPVHFRWVWLCGLTLGLSTWCHQLGLVFAVAVGIVWLAAKPASLLRAEGWRVAIGFLIGSAPLWLWNAAFGWITVRNFASQDYATRSLGEALNGFWESIGSLVGANSIFWSDPGGYAFWLDYGRVLFVFLCGFAVFCLLQPGKNGRAVRMGVGMQLLLIALTAGLYAKSRWGVTAGFSRYLLPVCAALPVLAGGAVARAWERSRTMALALLALIALPGIHDQLRYFEGQSPRGEGAKLAVAALDQLGIDRAYANVRISLPIALASRERIIVSDYYGVPYAPYLDAVDDAADVAVVTHRKLKIPDPEDAEASLHTLGGTFERTQAGPYVIFHHFHPPKLFGGWLPRETWKLSASINGDTISKIADRDMLTIWSTHRPRTAGDWVEVDLGAVHQVEEVHLLSGVRIHEFADRCAVETSLDGENWTERGRFDRGLAWFWWNGHPKHEDQGRLSFYFAPVPARYVRVRLLEGNPGTPWSIAEVFVRAADVPEDHGAELLLRTALLAERRGTIGVNYHTIHNRFAPEFDSTPWGEVLADLYRATAVTPDDPEPSYWLGRALWTTGFHVSPSHRANAERFEAVGLAAEAAREYAACVEEDGGDSFCLEHAVSLGCDPAETARLTELVRRAAPPRPLDGDLGAVRLVGTGEIPSEVKRGSHVRLELFWRDVSPLNRSYTVFVHLEGPNGARFTADHVPAREIGPTQLWPPGKTEKDAFDVEVPAGIPPGRYVVRVGLWNPRWHFRLRRGWLHPSSLDAASIQVIH